MKRLLKWRHFRKSSNNNIWLCRHPPFILAFVLCYGQIHAVLNCRPSRNGLFRICEIPEDIPPYPFDRGVPIDRNFSSPSKKHFDTNQRSRFNKESYRVEKRNSKFLPTFVGSPSPDQKTAVRFCMERAEENWKSNWEVKIRVNFSDLGDPFLLGTGQPSRNWLVDNYICPMPLAEAVLDEDLNSGDAGNAKFEILMTLNTGAKWHLGLDAKPPSGTYDLVTVCLHEVYHGLFMSGGNIAIAFNSKNLSYSAFFLREDATGRFDSFMANQDDCNITAYKNSPSNLGTVLTGNNLWFVSESERVAKLFSPRPYTPGSSIYHLSEAEYGTDDDQNGLMTPAIGSNFAQHNPGPIVNQMQSLILDVKGNAGADACEKVTPPKVDDTPITGGPGDQTGNGDREEGGQADGFILTIGDKEISGWILVGGAAGAVAAIVVISIVMRGVLSSKKSKEPKQARPQRRVHAGDLNFASGGNGGGIV